MHPLGMSYRIVDLGFHLWRQGWPFVFTDYLTQTTFHYINLQTNYVIDINVGFLIKDLSSLTSSLQFLANI